MVKLLLMALFAAGLAGWAILQVPWRDPAVRRKAVFLALLPLPTLLLLTFGPFGLVREPYDAGLKALMLTMQKVGLGATVLIALGFLAWLKGARPSALVLGGLAVAAATVVVGIHELMIDPRS